MPLSSIEFTDNAEINPEIKKIMGEIKFKVTFDSLHNLRNYKGVRKIWFVTDSQSWVHLMLHVDSACHSELNSKRLAMVAFKVGLKTLENKRSPVRVAAKGDDGVGLVFLAITGKRSRGDRSTSLRKALFKEFGTEKEMNDVWRDIQGFFKGQGLKPSGKIIRPRNSSQTLLTHALLKQKSGSSRAPNEGRKSCQPLSTHPSLKPTRGSARARNVGMSSGSNTKAVCQCILIQVVAFFDDESTCFESKDTADVLESLLKKINSALVRNTSGLTITDVLATDNLVIFLAEQLEQYHSSLLENNVMKRLLTPSPVNSLPTGASSSERSSKRRKTVRVLDENAAFKRFLIQLKEASETLASVSTCEMGGVAADDSCVNENPADAMYDEEADFFSPSEFAMTAFSYANKNDDEVMGHPDLPADDVFDECTGLDSEEGNSRISPVSDMSDQVEMRHLSSVGVFARDCHPDVTRAAGDELDEMPFAPPTGMGHC